MPQKEEVVLTCASENQGDQKKEVVVSENQGDQKEERVDIFPQLWGEHLVPMREGEGVGGFHIHRTGN